MNAVWAGRALRAFMLGEMASRLDGGFGWPGVSVDRDQERESSILTAPSRRFRLAGRFGGSETRALHPHARSKTVAVGVKPQVVA